MAFVRISVIGLWVLGACSTPAAEEASAEPAAAETPASAEVLPDGTLAVHTDAETTRSLLGAPAIEACNELLEAKPGQRGCVWQTPAGPSMMLKADGSAEMRVGPGANLVSGVWQVAELVAPFRVGTVPDGAVVEWDLAQRPDGVPDDSPSVLQLTKGAPRAGLLLGTDRIIHGFTPGSQAFAAGLRPGDVIASLNGDEAVAAEAQTFVAALPKKAGKVAKIGVMRDGKPVQVELEMRPYFECFRVWGEDVQPGVVDAPTGPSRPVTCPGWAPSLVVSK